jgi:hypothetical protein
MYKEPASSNAVFVLPSRRAKKNRPASLHAGKSNQKVLKKKTTKTISR